MVERPNIVCFISIQGEENLSYMVRYAEYHTNPSNFAMGTPSKAS